nr:MAG TPA: hypothetical protein [Caudoviricetes sp.]
MIVLWGKGAIIHDFKGNSDSVCFVKLSYMSRLIGVKFS